MATAIRAKKTKAAVGVKTAPRFANQRQALAKKKSK